MEVLQGDLSSFRLDEVIQLLADGAKTGVLRVETGSITGRLFFVEGSVAYATSRSGEGSVAALARLGSRPERDRRGRNVDGKWPNASRPLVLQQIAEVLVRVEQGASGRFWFVEGVVTRAYGPEEVERFDVGEVLRAVEGRQQEWREITRILPDAGARFVVRPTLQAGIAEVVVDAAAWSVLSVIGGGASAQDVAERLDLFELSAAGLLAGLYERGLIVLEHAAAAAGADLVHSDTRTA